MIICENHFLDKAYFLSFVDSDTFIDFGCADGSLKIYS